MRRFLLAMIFVGSMAAMAQAPSGQKPQPTAGDSANPFPEDTTNVPVMPSSAAELAAPAPSENIPETLKVHLPAIDIDPIHSPDDVPVTEEETTGESSSSSSLDKLLGTGGDDSGPADRKHHHDRPQQEKKKTQKDMAADDAQVGSYYLEKKNWKAAQSRYQSAMVLDPENPEVYWGLAEAAYHMGDLFTARGYYLKLVDIDPDGPHGRQLKKILKDSALLNAKPLPPAPVATVAPTSGEPDAPKQ